MTKPLFSIIILSYNNLQYLEECLSSILMQTYTNIEIIFSDDGSSNFDKNVILDFINKNKKGNIKRCVINHNSRNLGVVKNYNKAIELSEGEYIFYVGLDDMLYDENVVLDIVNFFKKSNSLIFTGYRCVYDKNMQECLEILPNKRKKEFIKNDTPRELHLKLSRGNFIAGSATPFSKKIIEKYGYLDEEYILLEDYPRYLSLTKQGCNIDFIDRKLIKYRAGGITTNKEKNEVLEEDFTKTRKKEVAHFVKGIAESINIKGKRIVGWGTSRGYKDNKDMFDYDISYLLDSDKNKHNKFLDGKKICSPEKLLDEDPEEIFVIVFSETYYYDIKSYLEKIGMKELENYCCFVDLLYDN
ncbi:putative glycosyltransferase [Halobacteroides halobius DSM 5150]|uniref:Putative glycosyltransferase n=1 Tax=Halobacteroides halobius (strain ATCC 35273 / DSM 5150 / MD-1) TaxID=748449 RepID=L0K9Y5_HALHC|nr:glycosyltransferase [Halobacteroides halobius]AGB42127.1 putative glycosyltransferase [Halobacteroides halobius DSM 5150]